MIMIGKTLIQYSKKLNKSSDGFALDVVTLFIIIFFSAVCLGMMLLLNNAFNNALIEIEAEGTDVSQDWFQTNVVNNLNTLDFMLPLLVAFSGIFIITTAYTSQSPAVVVVLFIITSLIGIIIIDQLSAGLENYWLTITSFDAEINWPYTTFVVNNIAIISAVIIAITGLVMHSNPRSRL